MALDWLECQVGFWESFLTIEVVVLAINCLMSSDFGLTPDVLDAMVLSKPELA